MNCYVGCDDRRCVNRIRELEAELEGERAKSALMAVSWRKAEAEREQTELANTRLRRSWREDTDALRAERDSWKDAWAAERDERHVRCGQLEEKYKASQAALTEALNDAVALKAERDEAVEWIYRSCNGVFTRESILARIGAK